VADCHPAGYDDERGGISNFNILGRRQAGKRRVLRVAMRLGIFGGTFDPIHYGHLILAESCREQLGLQQVWFLPAAVPPHKQQHVLTPGPQRIEMIELAIGGHEALAVCPYEIERGGVNYTVDTLAHLKKEDPARELFFLMGADSLRDLPSWREPARLCELAVPVAVGRAGAEISAAEIGSLSADLAASLADRVQTVHMPTVELSSSDLRARVACGESIRYRTPRAVEKYIESHGLYRAAMSTPEQRPGDRP
jgi:nicotinate-nucleotide adenylyltransferase